MAELDDLAGLGYLTLQLEPQPFDFLDRSECRGTGHLAAELDQECFTIRILDAGQRFAEAALRITGHGLQYAEEFF